MITVKDKIKKEATRLLRVGGYNAFSFRDLAQKTGIKSSSVHYYFPTKADLVEEIANDYRDRFFEALRSETLTLDSPKSKLLALIDLYEDSLDKNMNCLCGALAAEVDLLSLKEKRAIQRFFTELENWIRAVVVMIPGEKDMEPVSIARLLMSSLNGATVLDRANEGGDRLEAIRNFIKKSF